MSKDVATIKQSTAIDIFKPIDAPTSPLQSGIQFPYLAFINKNSGKYNDVLAALKLTTIPDNTPFILGGDKPIRLPVDFRFFLTPIYFQFWGKFDNQYKVLKASMSQQSGWQASIEIVMMIEFATNKFMPVKCGLISGLGAFVSESVKKLGENDPKNFIFTYGGLDIKPPRGSGFPYRLTKLGSIDSADKKLQKVLDDSVKENAELIAKCYEAYNLRFNEISALCD